MRNPQQTAVTSAAAPCERSPRGPAQRSKVRPHLLDGCAKLVVQLAFHLEERFAGLGDEGLALGRQLEEMRAAIRGVRAPEHVAVLDHRVDDVAYRRRAQAAFGT